MLTRLFSRNHTNATSPKVIGPKVIGPKVIGRGLEVILTDCDDHLLEDMGLLRDTANRLMHAPAEIYAYDLARFGSEFAGRRAA